MIELHAFGGLTHLQGEAPGPGRDILVSLAGPAAGLALGAIGWLVGRKAGLPEGTALAREAWRSFLWVNFGWSVLNLLPMLPLDGGHVMRSLVGMVTRSAVVPLVVSLCAAGVLGLAAWHAGSLQSFVLLAWLVVPVARQLWRAVAERRDAALEPALQDLLERAQADAELPVEEVEALAARLRSDRLRAQALQLLAWCHHQAGRDDLARVALDRLPPAYAGSNPALARAVAGGADEAGQALQRAREAWETNQRREETDAFLMALLQAGRLDEALHLGADAREVGSDALHRLQAAAFAAGRFEDSIAPGERLFAQAGNGRAAFNVGCAHARLGRTASGLDWLERAVEAGFASRADYDADPDIASLRASPGYAVLSRRLHE